MCFTVSNFSASAGNLFKKRVKLKTDFFFFFSFQAAKGAGWLSNAPLEPPCATYVGYRSCTTKLEKLVYMLNNAKALHKVASFVLRGIHDIVLLFSIIIFVYK